MLAFVFAALCAPPSQISGAQDGVPPQSQQADPKMAAPTPTPAAQADEEVERVESDLTNILLTAVDRERRFVTTLRQEDIRVLEDGVPQTVLAFQRETDLPLSLAILLDTSGSQFHVLKDEKAAAIAFLDLVMRPEKDTASIVSFTGLVKGEQLPTSDRTLLRAAVERVEALDINSRECGDDEDEVTEEERLRCSTAVWDAVWGTVNTVLSKTPESTRRAVILLSDGDDTVSETGRQEAIDFAVRHNTTVYAIGIRDEDFEYGKLARDSLRKISERTGGRAFFPESRAELDAAFAQINQELRSQYLVSYSPSNKRKDGSYRRVQLEVTNPALRKDKLRLLYRQGYYAKK